MVSMSRLRRHVLAFFQGNRHLLAPFVAHVVGLVPMSRPPARSLRRRRSVRCQCGGARAASTVTAVEGTALPPRIWRATRRPRPGRSRPCISPSRTSSRRPRPCRASRHRHRGSSSHRPVKEALDGIVALRPAARDLRVVRRGDTGSRRARLVDAGYAHQRGSTRSTCSRTRRTSRRSSSSMRTNARAEALRHICLVCAASRKPSNSGRNSPVRKKFSGCH